MQNTRVVSTTHWWCTRCATEVDMEAFRCECKRSPSPWVPYTLKQEVHDDEPSPSLLWIMGSGLTVYLGLLFWSVF